MMEETYELEYGSASVEMHADAVREGDRVVPIDDLVASGGTMMAGMRLLQRLDAAGLPLFTLMDFEGR